MSLISVLSKELARSNGKAKLVKVPKHMKPTLESLKQFENEVSAQIESNDLMRARSIEYAGYCKRYHRK